MTRRVALIWAIGLSLLASSSYAMAELRDPMRPSNAVVPVKSQISNGAKTPAKRWRLDSTMIIDNKRTAVINGKMVEAGQRINGAAVLEVLPGQVVLARDGKRFRVSILSPNTTVKTPAEY